MSYLFTSESVSEGHPDKVSDQISDALLDAFLVRDPNSKVACETLVTTGLVVCAGEVKTNGYVPVDDVARGVIKRIGYDKSDYQFDYKSCAVLSAIHSQSSDINQGVERANAEEQGAGDQGMMFGYACREMDNFMPISSELSHIILQELADIRREGKQMTYLRPDSKSQVTIQFSDEGKPERIDAIVVSTQHDDFHTDEKTMLAQIKKDVQEILLPRVVAKCPSDVQELFKHNYTLHVNPTGKFVIGGPHGDTGLTGRKIIVDTYGGKGAHGGGAFSGKDSSKVDRSAAYAARHIAKNMVAAGICDEILVQVAYAIGVAKPVGLYVNTYGTAHVNLSDGEIAKKIETIFDMRPYAIVNRFQLKNPIFEETASYGHFGRDFYEKEVEVFYTDANTYTKMVNGEEKTFKKVPFFAWEKLDYVEALKKAF
ncbi:MAG: methionine adenosyltransferase [Bacteroidetes bacterium]|nr:methionine adenosyltransferase [Bacteroidota bacterium]MCL2303191.1 methionine adenosyltransferase [Lentimicrobiaceae bacterium]